MKDSLDEIDGRSKSTEDTVEEEAHAQWKDNHDGPKLKSVPMYDKPIVIQKFKDEFSFNEYHSQR